MRGPLVRTSLLAALLFVGGACSGDWTFTLPAADAGVPDTRYASACTAWAKSFCAYDALCSPSPPPWQSIEQCTARQVLSCELIAADPDVRFDEKRVGECRYPTDCMSEVPNCWADGRAPSGSPCVWGPACKSGICQGSYPYTSSLVCGVCGTAPGQPCMASDACFSGSCGSSATTPAVCAPFASAGDSCGPGLPACGTGLACSSGFSEQTGQCDVERSPGEPCDSSIYCTSGACLAADGAGMRVCALLAKVGDVCGLDEPFCEPSLTCAFGSGTVGQCVDAPPVATGAVCYGAAHSNVFSPCLGFGTCGGICTPNVPGNLCCMPPSADGDPCDSVQGCLPPAQCIAGRCAFPSIEDCAL
jgi:hypothetical protein